nr:peroxinectin 1 transcription variant X2 [Limnephilus flavicornis]
MLRSTLLGLCVLSAVCHCSGLAPPAPVYKPTAAPVQKATTKPPVVTKAPVTTKVTAQTKSPPVKSFVDTNSDEYDPVEAKKTYPCKANAMLMPPCCGRVIAPCKKDDKYRSFDGSCNNLAHSEWGVPNSTYSRLLPPVYADGVRLPRRSTDKSPLPCARKVRTDLFPTGQVENALWPLNIMYWGQFLAHDMSLLKDFDGVVSCCTGDGQYQKGNGRFCYPIKIPPSDPTIGKAGIRCMNFTRTLTDKDMGCSVGNAPAKQLNTVTAYIDLSNVYGITDEIARSLRTMTNGELKTEKRGNRVFPPSEPNKAANCPCNAASENVCYKTGDSRSNQNPQLAIQQIMFVREHNRLAKELKVINPHWNDERLYQEARRINIAAFQHITYYEWLPILLGSGNLANNKIIFPDIQGFVNDYDSAKAPDVTNEHAHAAYRQFHTHIVGMLQLMNSERQRQSTVPISNWWNRPQILESGTNIEQLTVGMVTQPIEESDNIFVEQITDKLFACRGIGFGVDLKATDIQRDRDHALGYYNDYRKFCGLKVAQSWEDYGDYITPQNIAKLKTLYKSYKDVDVSVGGGLETIGEAQVGPTFLCILNEQFRRTRQADRFWFENPTSGLTLDQLYEIRKTSSSRLYCDNGDGISKIQPLSFVLIFPGFNEPIPCSEITKMDLTKWKENKPY